MTQDLVIVGCGGFGREVADVVDAINNDRLTWNLIGFLDDDASVANSKRVADRGSTVIGAIRSAPRSAHYVVAVGSGGARERIASDLDASGLRAATLIHPTANIGANTDVGDGTVVAGHVDIGSDVMVGQHVHLDRGVQVGHDSVVRDFATVHPAAVISGSCEVGTTVEIGTNATILQCLSVGATATVGAGACVVRDVAAGTTVKGIPAR